MTAVLEGVRGQQHAPAANPRERLVTHFTGGWVSPRAVLEGRKISTPVFDARTLEPVDIRYTVCATGAHLLQ